MSYLTRHKEKICEIFQALTLQYTLRPNILICFTLLYGQTYSYTKLNETLFSSKFSHKFTGFFQIQCFLPVRTAIQQVFNPNNLEFSILIFSDFSLFAIGHFVRSLRPSQWPQWAHQGIKWKLNITAFIWDADCWCRIKIGALRVEKTASTNLWVNGPRITIFERSMLLIFRSSVSIFSQ